MDIVHHALIGGTGMLAAAAHDQPLVGAAFVAGSVFPDLDVLFMAFGKRFYLRNHQGVTHSLLLSPLIALLLSLPLWQLPGDKPELWIWLAAWAGIGLHILLDLFNTFRIGLLSPFSNRRFSLDAVFFIDSAALLFTALFYLLHQLLDLTIAEILYPLAFAAYFLFKLWLHNRIMQRLKPLFAIPSSLNPMEFYILEESEEGLTSHLYNALTHVTRAKRTYAAVEERFHRLAARSQVFNDMLHIARALHIIEATEDQNGTTIIAADLAVRNFGGRFARTELRFDPQGRLVHEMANI